MSRERELIEMAKEEGFIAEKTNGGHLKFSHPEVGKPIFGASTPSDHRAIKNIRSMMRREKKAAGVGDSKQIRQGRRTEPFESREVPGSGGKTRIVYSARCHCCQTTSEVWLHSGSKEPIPATIAYRFRQQGWTVGITRAYDRCGTCPEPRPIGSRPMPQPAAPAQAPMSTARMPYIVGTGPSKEQRLAMILALQKAYKIGIGYVAGESDETVADRVKTYAHWVAAEREDLFGPLVNDSGIAHIRAEVLALERDLEKIKATVSEYAIKIGTRIAGINKALAALKKTET